MTDPADPLGDLYKLMASCRWAGLALRLTDYANPVEIDPPGFCGYRRIPVSPLLSFTNEGSAPWPPFNELILSEGPDSEPVFFFSLQGFRFRQAQLHGGDTVTIDFRLE